MATSFVKKVCGCGKAFETNNGSDKCFDCTLEGVAHGMSPEEGDFNTAGIISGTLNDQERSYLQQDLESVENGRTTQEEYEEEDPDEWVYNEMEAARLGDEG